MDCKIFENLIEGMKFRLEEFTNLVISGMRGVDRVF